MAVKIRLKRMGKIHKPFYRVVIMDSRAKRDGRAIEEIGQYHPTEEPSVIKIDGERAQHWLSQGAQPTEAVAALLKVTGDWQKFKGEPGAEGTLKVKEPKASKKDLYEAALASSDKEGAEHEAITAKKKADKEAADKKAADAKAAEDKAAADAKAAEEKAAAEAPAEDAPAEAETTTEA
ncbi:MAG: 30S ribosomal protein S16 [Janibacter sp.]|uniref:30S ribosomal protein S16 n=1 Tax=Janibacter limosus TaxID=53458 RepID=UPI00082DD3FB|nr:30S ribosomal protein S16 [Janibacter limosus]MDN5716665.1 30S ribosomal protein S16 [Janibacter sp.]